MSKKDREAEDVTQEVFVKLWKNIKKFNPEKKFKTWLFQIAKNTCIDFLRKNKNLVSAEAIDEEHMAMELENLADKNPLPQELLDSEHFAKKLEEILNTLPQPQKLTVTLYLQNDLTFLEIAEILNQPLNTVKSRYRRALLSIRESLNNQTIGRTKNLKITYK